MNHRHYRCVLCMNIDTITSHINSTCCSYQLIVFLTIHVCDLTVFAVESVYIKDATRDHIYSNWKKWLNTDSVPKRITWDCCAQCVVTKDSIHKRSLGTYESVYQHVVKGHDIKGNSTML